MTGLTLILALAVAAQAADPPVDDRPPAAADETLALFSALCLDGMPSLEGAGDMLAERGFPERNVAGLSEHPDRALSVIVNANEDLENIGAGCMVAAFGPEYETLRRALEEEIASREGFVGGPVLNVESATGQPFWAARRGNTQVVAGRTAEMSVFLGASIVPEPPQ